LSTLQQRETANIFLGINGGMDLDGGDDDDDPQYTF